MKHPRKKREKEGERERKNSGKKIPIQKIANIVLLLLNCSGPDIEKC